MLYVFVGMTDTRNTKSYYNTFVKFCAISMAIGILLYIATPSWYVERQTELINSTWFADTIYSEENVMNAYDLIHIWHLNMRFLSFLCSD
jgi:hypothetical protein